MTTVEDLLNEVNSNYSVISIEDKGTTAGGKIKEYDLWYDDNGIVRFKRLHIYDDGTIVKWYSENPIPKETPPIETFDKKIKKKIEGILSTNKDIKHIRIEDIDLYLERATAIVWVNESGTVNEKKAAIYKADDGSIQFELL